MTNTTVNLLSGGMDSYLASRLYKVDVNVHINFNEKYSAKQLRVVENLRVNNLQVVDGLDLSRFIASDGSYLPNRNALFVTLAAMFGDDIVLSATLGDVHPDKDAEFAAMMSALLSKINNGNYQVRRPFGALTKQELIRLYLNHGHRIEDLYVTTSCYHPTEHACMECRPCLRRMAAFASHGYRVDEFIPLIPKIIDMLMDDSWTNSDRADLQTITFLRRLGQRHGKNYLGLLGG